MPDCSIPKKKQIRVLQRQANLALHSLNLQTIPITGTFDPKTCGAFAALALTTKYRKQLPDFVQCQWFLNLCKRKEMPRKKGKKKKKPSRLSDLRSAAKKTGAKKTGAKKTGAKKTGAKKGRKKCVLKPRDKGRHVRRFQRRLREILKARGYEPIPVTGTMNRKTCGAAVMLRKNYRNTAGSWKSLSKYAPPKCSRSSGRTGAWGFRISGCNEFSKYPKYAPKPKIPAEARRAAADRPMDAWEATEVDEEMLRDEQMLEESDEDTMEAAEARSYMLWGGLALLAVGGVYVATRKKRR